MAYKAQAGSPGTVLAIAIAAGDTSLIVVSGEAFSGLDLPNYLTLGYAQNVFETVKVTAIAGNTLTVVRGVEGTNQAWDSGTEIARVFTAKDWDELMEDVAGKAVPSDIPAAATAVPLMDGEGAVGNSTKYARENHVHPSDTAKQNKITSSASGDIAAFERITEGLPLNSLKIAINPVQAGAGDPSPSNVRPITGWTGANVTRAGKNLLPKGADRTASGINYAVQSNGEVVVTGTATATSFWAVQFSLPPGTYSLNGCPAGGGNSTYVIDVRNAVGGSGISGISGDSGGGSTFTLTADLTAYVNIRIASGYSAPAGGLTLSPMIRPASISDSTYEPYRGTTYPISWQSEAGTVYGGELDVTTGVLTVDRVQKDYAGGSDESWSVNAYNGRYRAYTAVSDIATNVADSAVADILCNMYKAISYNQGTVAEGISARYNNGQINVFQTVATSTAEWKTWLASHPLTVVYPLATPVTYQLTPTEVTTLLGANNIWADTGEILEARFDGDVKKAVDSKQPVITVSGILVGDGNGGIDPATEGNNITFDDGEISAAGLVNYTATISGAAADWSTDANGYQTQTVTGITGLKATYPVAPLVDVVLSGTDNDADAARLEAWGLISIVTTATDSIVVKCAGDAPQVNVPVIISVWE